VANLKRDPSASRKEIEAILQKNASAPFGKHAGETIVNVPIPNFRRDGRKILAEKLWDRAKWFSNHKFIEGRPMKTIIRVALMIASLLMGFAAGFPIGQSKGFSTGSEWAFVQANILARESGLFMPVNFEAGQFRVILKQPKYLYKRAWMLADRHKER
jgi:hypothetical protein